MQQGFSNIRAIALLLISGLAVFVVTQQTSAGPITNPGGSPYSKMSVYQGVLTIAPGGNEVMEIGNAGRDIAAYSEIYLRPGGLISGTANYIKVFKNTDNLASMIVPGQVGINQPAPGAKLAVNNPSDLTKKGSASDAVYAYAHSVIPNTPSAAISGENPGIDIDDWAGFFSGRVMLNGDVYMNGNCFGTGCRPVGTSGQTVRYDASNVLVATSNIFNSPSGANADYVGIGTNNPASKLHVYGGPTWGTIVSVDAGAGAGSRRYDLISTNNTASEGGGKLLIKDNNFAAPNVRLAINSAGNVGIGTPAPNNLLAVTPTQYSIGTASQALFVVTGVGTTFTTAMVGSQIVFASGQSATITAFGSITSLTVGTSQTVSPAQAYKIVYPGLQVANTGNVGINQAAPGAKLAVNNPSDPTKVGSAWDAVYAYAHSVIPNTPSAAISAENPGTDIDDWAGYFNGRVRVTKDIYLDGNCIGTGCGGNQNLDQVLAIGNTTTRKASLGTTSAPEAGLVVNKHDPDPGWVPLLTPPDCDGVAGPPYGGCVGSPGDGIAVYANSGNAAIYAEQKAPYSTYGGYAGYFSGNVFIDGELSVDDCTGCSPFNRLGNNYAVQSHITLLQSGDRFHLGNHFSLRSEKMILYGNNAPATAFDGLVIGAGVAAPSSADDYLKLGYTNVTATNAAHNKLRAAQIFWGAGTGGGDGLGSLHIASRGDGQTGLSLYTSPNAGTGVLERLKITGTGNVGINQAAPGAKLAVNNPSDPAKFGSASDAVYSYAHSTIPNTPSAAISGENPGTDIDDWAGYFNGRVIVTKDIYLNGNCFGTGCGGAGGALDATLALGNKSDHTIQLGYGLPATPLDDVGPVGLIDVLEDSVTPRNAISAKVTTANNTLSAIYGENPSGTGFAGYFSGQLQVDSGKLKTRGLSQFRASGLVSGDGTSLVIFGDGATNFFGEVTAGETVFVLCPDPPTPCPFGGTQIRTVISVADVNLDGIDDLNIDSVIAGAYAGMRMDVRPHIAEFRDQGDTPRVVFSSTGNVGINTQVPRSFLQVGSGGTAANLYTGASNNIATQWNVTSEAATAFNQSTARIGLNIHNNNTTAANWSRLSFSTPDGANPARNTSAAMIATQFTGRTVGGFASGDLAFFTSPGGGVGNGLAERMRILGNGKVGINQTTPGAKLAVNNNPPDGTKVGDSGDTVYAYARNTGALSAKSAAISAENPGTGTDDWAGYFSGKVLVTTDLLVNGDTTVNNLTINGTCTGCGGSIFGTPGSIPYFNTGSSLASSALYYMDANRVYLGTPPGFTGLAEHGPLTVFSYSGNNIYSEQTSQAGRAGYFVKKLPSPTGASRETLYVENNYDPGTNKTGNAALIVGGLEVRQRSNGSPPSDYVIPTWGVQDLVKVVNNDSDDGALSVKNLWNTVGGLNKAAEFEGNVYTYGKATTIWPGAYFTNINSVGDTIGAYSNTANSAIYAQQLNPAGWAGYFDGKVNITGNLFYQGRLKPTPGQQVCEIATDTCLGQYVGTILPSQVATHYCYNDASATPDRVLCVNAFEVPTPTCPAGYTAATRSTAGQSYFFDVIQQMCSIFFEEIVRDGTPPYGKDGVPVCVGNTVNANPAGSESRFDSSSACIPGDVGAGGYRYVRPVSGQTVPKYEIR